MTLIDAFLRERGATLAVDGLDAGWSTVLVTPWWHASRHVVALVYSRRDGRMVLVLKLPRRPGDEGGIRKEAESLRLLAQVSPRAAERGPRVVALTRFRGISLLAETAVCGEILGPEVVRRDAGRAERASVALVRSLPRTASHLDDPGWFDRLLERPLLAAVEATDGREPVRSVVKATLAALEPLRVVAMPLVFEHGDLAHPNLVLRQDGELAAVDWERSEVRGLPLHDLSFLFQYLAEATARVFDAQGRCGVFDGAFLGRDAWGRRPLLDELDRLSLPPNLLAPLVLSTWARSAVGLLPRLWAAAGRGGRVSAEEVAASFGRERDYVLWRHVVGRLGALAAT
jgi:aminoglycoside phosphotransferase (APT) family kinase protein